MRYVHCDTCGKQAPDVTYAGSRDRLPEGWLFVHVAIGREPMSGVQHHACGPSCVPLAAGRAVRELLTLSGPT